MNRFVPILVVGGYVGVSYSFIARKNYGTSCEASGSDPFESSLSKIRNSLNEYKHVPWNQKKNEVLIRNHALFDTLSADDRVELYEIYQHKSKQELVALLKFGNTLNGYPGILHGGECCVQFAHKYGVYADFVVLTGISALVIDNTYGVLFMNLGLPPAFTANLNLNYRFANVTFHGVYFLIILLDISQESNQAGLAVHPPRQGGQHRWTQAAHECNDRRRCDWTDTSGIKHAVCQHEDDHVRVLRVAAVVIRRETARVEGKPVAQQFLHQFLPLTDG